MSYDDDDKYSDLLCTISVSGNPHVFVQENECSSHLHFIIRPVNMYKVAFK